MTRRFPCVNFNHMEPKQITRADYSRSFFNVETKEPHKARGVSILKAHPEVRSLQGPYIWSIAYLLLIVGIQTVVASQMGQSSIWIVLLVSWIVGAILNHSLFVMIHDATHNLIFKKTSANRWAGILANLAIGVPMAMAFRSFHLLHHLHQGDPEYDADLPSVKEAGLVGNSSSKKALWLLSFLFIESFYRPRLVRHANIPPIWLFLNFAVVIAYCAALIYFFGPMAYLYLLLSTMFSVGLHPLGARWIQEHFVVKEGQETYSYYGPFNWVMFNVGYHNEHHDLPYVPWINLPKLKKMAPEMYNTLHFHTSYWALLRRFIFDPKLGMHSRVVRRRTASNQKILTPKSQAAELTL